MVEIVQKGHKALSIIASEVLVDEINSSKIQKIISDMKEALDSQDDGLAIAAPQIGISLRIFIISGRLFTKKNSLPKPDKIYINPKFVRFSKKKEWKVGEGCLSLRWLYGSVQRHTSVTIEAYNELGVLIKENASGMLAHIFQHEMDHLDGILFDSKARDIEEHLPESSSTQTHE